MAGRPVRRSKKTPSPVTNDLVKQESVNQSPNAKELVIGNKNVGVTNQKYAQMINYAELERILTQNVSKSTNKTFTQYTKERLQNFIRSPLSNIDNIRDVSNFLYRVSHNYKKIIEYYSLMPLYSYNIEYDVPDYSKGIQLKDFFSGYQELCIRLDNMNLKRMGAQILATTLRDGIYVGYTYDDEESFFISALDPKYCKISDITAGGTFVVKFDASFFDTGNNKEFLYGINEDGEGTWDQSFIDGYEAYKELGNEARWFELPIERTICVICGDDPQMPLPYFLPVFVSLLDLLDYEALIRSKAELENYVLLVSKIPLLNSDQVNDFAVDLDLVRATQDVIDEVAPSLAATCFSPCEIEPIFFNNKNQVEDTNVYSEALSNLFSSLGISEMLFNGDKGGSVGLKHSIEVDMTLVFDFLAKIEANIQRYVFLNISEDFRFYFHRVTYFNKEEYNKELNSKATLGMPFKLDYATVDKSPRSVWNATFMEQSMGISDLWNKPLASSYTQSGSANDNEGGAPEKDPDDLQSDASVKAKDNGKNEEAVAAY